MSYSKSYEFLLKDVSSLKRVGQKTNKNQYEIILLMFLGPQIVTKTFKFEEKW